MKKYLYIISTISIVSLIVLIFIQTSWLKLNLNQEEQQLKKIVIKVLRKVGEEISAEMKITSNNYNNLHTHVPLHFSENVLSVKNFFNKKKIEQGLKKEFVKEGYRTIVFKAGIVKNNSVLVSTEFKNDLFLNSLNDTIRNKIFGFPLQYKNVINNLSNINQIEILYIVIKNSKLYLIKKIGISIALMVFFTCIILIGIYSTIKIILKQEQFDEMKTNFINNMTHEFKTPISTIAISLSTLKQLNKKVANSEEIEPYLEIIKTENNRMLEMVELILSNAILSKGEIRLNKKPLSLHEILEKIIIKHHLLLHEKNAVLLSDLVAKNDIILGDSTQLLIAISNLIENAIKYSKDFFELTIYTKQVNNAIEITITDNGIGISKENLKHIFKKFYRVNTNNLHNIKGFGLGLNYTKTIINAHSGTIDVKSKLDEGTTFTILFPTLSLNELENV